MQMRVMEKILPPGMQDGKVADMCAQVLGIGSNGEQRLGCSAKQNIVDHPLVIERNLCNLFGYGEDNVKIGNRQKFAPALIQPLCPGHGLAGWTMTVAARVIPVAFEATLAALEGMATEGCRAANLDGAHQP